MIAQEEDTVLRILSFEQDVADPAKQRTKFEMRMSIPNALKLRKRISAALVRKRSAEQETVRAIHSELCLLSRVDEF